MSTKKRNIIIILGVLAVAIGGVVLSILFGSRAEKIAPNPTGTIGNTAGNLYNGGYYCELDGKVYFANTFDNGAMYSMNSDESDIKRISSVRACNILAAGNYLYYFQLGVSGETGLGGVRTPYSYNRSKLDGSKAVSIVREVVTNAQLIDNSLFLLVTADAGPHLISIGTDRSDEKVVANFILNPSSAKDGYIYYSNTSGDHYLNRMDTNSGLATTLLQENVWSPIVNGNYIYYLSLDNDYQLRRYNISENTIEILSNQKIQNYNLGGGYIYYQTSDDNPGLYCMNYDGSNAFLLDNGQFSDISITSRYVYFTNFFDENITYHSPLGSSYYETFSGASMAAMKDK